MHRVNAIIHDERFIKRMKEIQEYEADRIFCKHGYDHLIAVARIAYILAFETKEKNPDYHMPEKEIIYAMAILHDIGKFLDDEMGMNHRDIGPILAAPILKDVGFSEEETEMICHAIKMHGTYPEDKGSLAGLLYIADKKARRCFDCPAHDECNWPDEKKNEVLYG
ncbi:MAG: HD domain-containing protein [Eubacterium sp.]|nr:HD domain-containing protein [Eubacterium sp.]